MNDLFEKDPLKSAEEGNIINEVRGVETGVPGDSPKKFGYRDPNLLTSEDIPGLKRLIELSRLAEWPKK